LDAYSQGRNIIEKINDEYLLIYIDLAEATIARQRGDTKRAHTNLKSARSLLQESKAEFSRGPYLLQSGLLALAENDINQAVAALIEANELFATGGQRPDEIRANCLLAAAEYENENTEQAFRRFDQACRLANELDVRNILVQSARQVKRTLTKMASSETIGMPAIRLLEEVTAFEADLTSLKKKLRMQETVVVITPPRLRIQAFGQIQVTLDDKPLTGSDWQTLVTRDLLYLVLSNQRGWSKEGIGEILWPESSHAKLNQRFKNTIYRLRRALNQDVIIYSDGIYTFNREIDYEYDVERFEDFLAKARIAIGGEAQIEAYRAALQIYAGDYLPGMDGKWVLTERERLQRSYLVSGLRLAELYMKTMQHAKALEVCHRLICVDPCLEEAYRTAMNLYAYKGDRAAITKLYVDLQNMLLEIAGAPPSPQTENLYLSLVT